MIFMVYDSWEKRIFLWMVTPRHTIRIRTVILNPATSFRLTTLRIICSTRCSVPIISGCTSEKVTLTKPRVTRVSVIRLRTTIRTFCITRTIDCTFVMCYPTISHASGIVITIGDAFINISIADVFAFQFIFRIPENLFNVARIFCWILTRIHWSVVEL